MKHSDAIKALLLATISEIADDPKLYAVNPGKDFTRNRKLGFHETIMVLLTMGAIVSKKNCIDISGDLHQHHQRPHSISNEKS